MIAPSFRDGPKDQTRNLEIPRCAIAHLRSGANAPSRNDAELSALFDQIVLEDRHLELEGAVVVFVIDKEHADEFLADIDLG